MKKLGKFSAISAAFLVLAFAGVPSARANSYLFAISPNALLTDIDDSSAGLYAFFLQPVGAPNLSNYVANSAELPTDPADTNIQWIAGTFDTAALLTENSFDNSGQWIEFAKNPALASGSNVALISNQSGFTGQSYQVNADPSPTTDPAAFGGNTLTFNQLVTSSALFRFELNINSSSTTVQQDFRLYGAYVSYSSSGPAFYSEQHSADTPFDLVTLTGTAPEPGTFVFLGAGLVAFASVKLRRANRGGRQEQA